MGAITERGPGGRLRRHRPDTLNSYTYAERKRERERERERKRETTSVPILHSEQLQGERGEWGGGREGEGEKRRERKREEELTWKP